MQNASEKSWKGPLKKKKNSNGLSPLTNFSKTQNLFIIKIIPIKTQQLHLKKLKIVNWHNSRTSDDIKKKLELVIQLDKKNKITTQKFDDDLNDISKN